MFLLPVPVGSEAFEFNKGVFVLKTRVLSSIVLVLLLILTFIFSGVNFVLSIVISLLSAGALYEVLAATKYIESKTLIVISLLFAVIVPFMHYTPEMLRTSFSSGVFLFAMVLFVSLLLLYKKFSLEHLSVVFLLSLIVPMFFSTIIYSRELPMGQYNFILVFFVLGLATAADTSLADFSADISLLPSYLRKKQSRVQSAAC